VQYRDRLVEAYLTLVQLVRSRVITEPTRMSAEILKAKLEAELVNEAASPNRSDRTAIAADPETLNKKAAS
jgi:hypothetical protein